MIECDIMHYSFEFYNHVEWGRKVEGEEVNSC